MDLQEAFDAGFEAVKIYVDSSLGAVERRLANMEQVIADLLAPKEVDEAGIVKRAAAVAAESLRPMLEGLQKSIEALPEAPEVPDVPGMIKEALGGIGDQREQDAAQIQAWMDDVARKFAALPEPAEPVPFDPESVRGVLAEEVARAVGDLPKPKDGKSVTVADLAPLIADQVARSVAQIPSPRDGVDGKSVTMQEILPVLSDLMAKAMADIRVPADGKDGANGKDGRDGLNAVTPILKDGFLLFTMSDGSVVEVGHVVGRAGKDGKDGKDGIDGLGFDDMTAEYDGERGVTLRFAKGEQVKTLEMTLPIVIDRGVWLESKPDGYTKGDGVTWAGSYWISQKNDNADKPDGGDGWRLAVKRGRDGKSGTIKTIETNPVRVSQ